MEFYFSAVIDLKTMCEQLGMHKELQDCEEILSDLSKRKMRNIEVGCFLDSASTCSEGLHEVQTTQVHAAV